MSRLLGLKTFPGMQAVVCYGRFIARTITASLTGENAYASSPLTGDCHLVTAASGFSKSHSKAHVPKKYQFGDDAYFVSKHKIGEVIGVADGVGGWRQYGVDPSLMPTRLMATCSGMVRGGYFKPHQPKELLRMAFEETLLDKNPAPGSTTACLVSLDVADSTLHTANLGDSGFMVVRKGKVVLRSQEQQHYFNTPYQLNTLSAEYDENLVLSDSPTEAETTSMGVEAGDIILVATDGLFDNMSDLMILRHLQNVKPKAPDSVTKAAVSIAAEARDLSLDPEYVSPFSVSAKKNGYNFKGGKPDDVTVVLALVDQGQLGEFV